MSGVMMSCGRKERTNEHKGFGMAGEKASVWAAKDLSCNNNNNYND
jgi:hypothetical protein